MEKTDTKLCRTCKSEILRKKIYSDKYWARRKYCSKQCLYKGDSYTNLFQKGHKDFVPKESRGHSEETRKKIGLGGIGKHVNEKAWNWKGDKVGYSALHRWIRNHYGTPDTCEECGSNGLTGRKIHWANLSGHYKRLREDWRRLCAKCHKAFDMGRARVV